MSGRNRSDIPPGDLPGDVGLRRDRDGRYRPAAPAASARSSSEIPLVPPPREPGRAGANGHALVDPPGGPDPVTDSGFHPAINAPLGTGASPGLRSRAQSTRPPQDTGRSASTPSPERPAASPRPRAPARPERPAPPARASAPRRPRVFGSPTPRRVPGKKTGTVTGALGIALLLGVGAWAVVDSATTCDPGNPVRLRVAAAPEIAPAVTAIAKDFNAAGHDVGGRCVEVTGTAVDPATSAALLSGQGAAAGQRRPDVWIPDSSLWVTLVHASEKGRVTVSPTPTSVARSPIVAAVPRAQADRLRESGGRPTWNALLKAAGALEGTATKGGLFPPGSIRLQALDPSRHAGGLAPLIMTHMMLHNDPEADEILADLIEGLRENVAPDAAALFGRFTQDAEGRWPVAILPEQTVWKRNRDSGGADQAVALYPADGTISMNYPYTLVTKDPDKLRGAELLRVWMTGTRAQAAVQRIGFRTAADRPSKDFGPRTGVSPEVPYALPAPTAEDLDLVVRAWSEVALSVQGIAPLGGAGSFVEPPTRPAFAGRTGG